MSSIDHMIDDDESCCVCCMSCPRAVRTQPCGHAIYCELCTIRAVQAKGLKCGVCRGAVLQLVVVPVNPAGDPPLLRSMQTYTSRSADARAGGKRLREPSRSKT